MAERNAADADGTRRPTVNTITGEVFFEAVIQGRDIAVQLPPPQVRSLLRCPDSRGRLRRSLAATNSSARGWRRCPSATPRESGSDVDVGRS